MAGNAAMPSALPAPDTPRFTTSRPPSARMTCAEWNGPLRSGCVSSSQSPKPCAYEISEQQHGMSRQHACLRRLGEDTNVFRQLSVQAERNVTQADQRERRLGCRKRRGDRGDHQKTFGEPMRNVHLAHSLWPRL